MIHDPVVILKPEMVKIAKTARIDAFVKIEGGQGVSLGEFVHIGTGSCINVGGGRVIFEDHSGCSVNCSVAGATADWSFLYASAAEPSEHHHTRRYLTRICAFAILFMGAIIVPGITIGEGAIVKPGSVVYDDVPAWKIVQGNPARVVGTRNVSQKVQHESNGRIRI